MNPKKLVEIDEELLACAQGILGTQSVDDTIREALLLAVRRGEVKALSSMEGPDLDEPKDTARAWSV